MAPRFRVSTLHPGASCGAWSTAVNRAERRAPARPGAAAADAAELVIPRATYRLQLNAGFPSRHAIAVVAYLAPPGISHVYCSPYFRARAGSTHGYDVVDHNSFNPEIGTAQEFESFVSTLRAHDMGHIVDIVPNHVGILGADNAWWMDVLENGEASAYAGFFDIDWAPPNPERAHKVLVPVLGAPYGIALERGELQLRFEPAGGSFAVFYHAHRMPLDPRTYPRILDRAAALVTDQSCGAVENARIGARIERHAMRVIEDGERAARRLKAQLQLAALQRDAVRGTQHRHQHLVRALGIGGRPVDVEETGVSGCLAVFQHVHPPGVVGAEDADVVGDDVDDVSHVVGPQGAHEALELLGRADLGVEAVVIDHVVAVRAAGAGAEVGRAVHVADAERGQVRHHRDGVAERETGVELQAVGRPWDHGPAAGGLRGAFRPPARVAS